MMNEFGNLFPSGFQCGLRILVVQDDETCNQVIEQMLKSWNYQVTISRRGDEAISLLRENKGNYDIVISDFNKPDMDGLKFLKIVGLMMNLPVLVIIGDESRDIIIKGIENGVCQYLVKPIRRDDLRHIWQHVVRKKRKELKEQEQMSLIENSESQYVMPNDVKEISTNKDAAETSDIMKRRRDGEYDQSESCDDVMRSKKTRLAWTKELHETFVRAVNELGVDMAVPKKILEFMHRMGISDITRENIASHLQKYRMNLKRTPSSDYTSSVGPSDQHYYQQSYAFNEMSRVQAGASSCQVPITSPRVSQENQYFNANSSLFGHDHINHEFEKMKVVVSGYEMDQQFNNNETLQGNLIHRYSNSTDMRHQLILSSKQQDPTLSSLGAEINNPIYANPSQPCMLNEIEAKNKMLCGGIENDHESCGFQMYAPSLANGTHDHDQAAFIQNVTPLAAPMQNSHDVVTCYPNIEMSQHGFPLHHANSIEDMVYKNESPISNYSLIDRDHDFGNINVQHYNKNLFQNHSEYHHGSSSRLSCDTSIHVKQQSLDLDDYMTRPFIEESSELAQNRTTSNGYPTDNVQI